MKTILVSLALVAVLAPASLAGHGDGNGGTGNPGQGHDPVTICHKPGTPAQQTLVVDDDSVELTGHLGHGDTLGPCEELPPVEPPVTPPTTPPSHCAYTGAGKDGQVDAYGGTNDDCAPLPQPPTSEPPAPVCENTTTVVTVEKIVPKVVTRVVTKYRTKVVHRTKVRTIVKRVKVYVPGVHPDGVEGSG